MRTAHYSRWESEQEIGWNLTLHRMHTVASQSSHTTNVWQTTQHYHCCLNLPGSLRQSRTTVSGGTTLDVHKMLYHFSGQVHHETLNHCYQFHRVHSKLKGQNSRTFQGLLKDLKLQYQVPKKVLIKRRIILALHQNLEWNIIYSAILH